jgi:hypothetical protein
MTQFISEKLSGMLLKEGVDGVHYIPAWEAEEMLMHLAMFLDEPNVEANVMFLCVLSNFPRFK